MRRVSISQVQPNSQEMNLFNKFSLVTCVTRRRKQKFCGQTRVRCNDTRVPGPRRASCALKKQRVRPDARHAPEEKTFWRQTRVTREEKTTSTARRASRGRRKTTPIAR